MMVFPLHCEQISCHRSVLRPFLQPTTGRTDPAHSLPESPRQSHNVFCVLPMTGASFARRILLNALIFSGYAIHSRMFPLLPSLKDSLFIRPNVCSCPLRSHRLGSLRCRHSCQGHRRSSSWYDVPMARSVSDRICNEAISHV